jgi:hypothetical protein
MVEVYLHFPHSFMAQSCITLLSTEYLLSFREKEIVGFKINNIKSFICFST